MLVDNNNNSNYNSNYNNNNEISKNNKCGNIKFIVTFRYVKFTMLIVHLV